MECLPTISLEIPNVVPIPGQKFEKSLKKPISQNENLIDII